MNDPVRDERAIRNQRMQFNEAIAAHDRKRVSAFWLPDIQIMTSAGNALNGRDAVQRAFDAFFADPNFVTFVRNTISVRVSEDGARAAESGEWEGHWRDEDLQSIQRGAYMGSWHRESGRWMLQCELFVPLG